MSAPIITVEGVSKSYVLRHQQRERYTALRDVIASRVKNMFRSGATTNTAKEEFFALRDVSFTVNAGDRVGIIGRNGAGKSTLLKVLSRITLPSAGRVVLDGRVASLLEVGTGFHPELTGRENIFLNGAILGMQRAEINAKFDEIVAFAEVERFLDTPVKRYSSGMYVRLAFAVAAHLEPEILIVDEVLAVGDAKFQRKCLGKMESVAVEGRTVIFVSHNMEAVSKLCDKGLLLHQGRLVASGPMSSVIRTYLDEHNTSQGVFTLATSAGDRPGETLSITFATADGMVTGAIPLWKAFSVTVAFRIDKPLEHFIASIGISSMLNHDLRTIWSVPQRIRPGIYTATFHLDDIHLAPGRYKLVIGLSEHERSFQQVEDTAWFEVLEATDEEVPAHIVNYRSSVILDQCRVDIEPAEKHTGTP